MCHFFIKKNNVSYNGRKILYTMQFSCYKIFVFTTDERLLSSVVLGTSLLSKVSYIHNGKLRSCFENVAGYLFCKFLSDTSLFKTFLGYN